MTGFTVTDEAVSAGAAALDSAKCICEGANQHGRFYAPKPNCPACGDSTAKSRVVLEAAARTAQPACWCGGEVGPRSPGDAQGLGCQANIMHAWRPEPQLTATREKLTEALKGHMSCVESYGDRDPYMPMEECLFCTCDPGEPLCTWVQTSPDDTSDERFRVAWADHVSAVLASGVVQEAPQPCAHAWEEINPGNWMCKELCGADVDLTRSPDWRSEADLRADELIKFAEDYLYDADIDTAWPGYSAAFDRAAAIRAGETNG